MADQGDTFLRELDEEMRRERFEKLWAQYGTYVLAGAALIVVGVGGYQLMRHRALTSAQEAGARYQKAAQAPADEADKLLREITEAGPAAYGVLAKLRIAGAAAKAGKTAEALATYESIARSEQVDPLVASYGQLQAAALRLDSAGWTEMQNRLRELTDDKGPWRFAARELLGQAALKAGNLAEARKVFEALLSDPKVPSSIGERTNIMLALITSTELAKGPAAAPAQN